MTSGMTSRIWAASALLHNGWADSVEIDIDANGNIASISADTPASISADTPNTGGDRVELLIAAIPNVHSHAHQRAMAGLGERHGDSADSFWTWRKVMYHYLERIQPEHLGAR